MTDTDFGEIIGSFLVGLAHARRMADEQTAALAEYYRSHPLLQGMSVPRVRVPEMSIELPVVLLEHRPAEPRRLRSVDDIRQGLSAQLGESLRQAGAGEEEIATLQQRSEQLLESRLNRLAQPEGGAQVATIEGVQRVVGEAVDAVMSEIDAASPTPGRLGAGEQQRIRKDVRDYIDRSVLEYPGQPSRFVASALTSEVKDRADAANVARIRIVLKEEGLEWSVSSVGEGGTTRGTLIPE